MNEVEEGKEFNIGDVVNVAISTMYMLEEIDNDIERIVEISVMCYIYNNKRIKTIEDLIFISEAIEDIEFEYINKATDSYYKDVIDGILRSIVVKLDAELFNSITKEKRFEQEKIKKEIIRKIRKDIKNKYKTIEELIENIDKLVYVGVKKEAIEIGFKK